jgi:hypothetical protein
MVKIKADKMKYIFIFCEFILKSEIYFIIRDKSIKVFDGEIL